MMSVCGQIQEKKEESEKLMENTVKKPAAVVEDTDGFDIQI